MNENEEAAVGVCSTTGENYTGPKWQPAPHEVARYEAWAESRHRLMNLSNKIHGDPRAAILKKMSTLGIGIIFGSAPAGAEPQPELKPEYERRRFEHNEKYPLPCPILRGLTSLPDIANEIVVGIMPVSDDDTVFARHCTLVGSLIMTSLEVAKEPRKVVADLGEVLTADVGIGRKGLSVLDEACTRDIVLDTIEKWKPGALFDAWKLFESVVSAQSKQYREKRDYFEDLAIRTAEKVGNET